MSPTFNRQTAEQCIRNALATIERCVVNPRCNQDDVSPSECPTGICHRDAKMMCGATVPGLSLRSVIDWVGPRLMLWSPEFGQRRRIALMSSRLGKRPDQRRFWFDALRTAVLRVDPDSECLLLVEGTAAFESVRRAAELFDTRSIKLIIQDDSVTIDQTEAIDWLTTQVHAFSETNLSRGDATLFMSPRLSGYSAEVRAEADPRGLPLQDRCLALFSERILVLSCRSSGNTERTLMKHLKDPERSHVPVLAATPQGLRSTGPKRLVKNGAIPWILHQDVVIPDHRHAKMPVGCHSRRTEIDQPEDGPLLRPELWLAHWTRPRFGPWPGETRTDFLDQLVLGCETADRSAFATLLQILSAGRIMDSKSAMGSRESVVSFTAVPLAEFRSRRVFRAHRNRYDFEPWGISIRKDRLVQSGARRVTYGTEQQRQQLPDSERTFFQPEGNDRINWRDEQEWRHPGSVNLNGLAPYDVVVFTDTPEEAQTLTGICPWNVVQTPDATY